MKNQCKKPTGWLGRWMLRNMNSRHSKLTDWGLAHISAGVRDTILDVGCGGGRTVSKLAAMAPEGKVYGIDHSADSVATSRKTNAGLIDNGRVEIQQGSVSQLPFSDGTFDRVTAVETHFFWPNLPHDVGEVWRVLKPGGTAILIAEIYKGAHTAMSRLAEKYSHKSGMTLLTVDEHRQLLENAGFSDIQVEAEASKGWICAMGKKP